MGPGSRVLLQHGLIQHDIAYNPAMTIVLFHNDLPLTASIPNSAYKFISYNNQLPII